MKLPFRAEAVPLPPKPLNRVRLAPVKEWPYKQRMHVIENIQDWPDEADRMAALTGVGLLDSQEIYVYVGLWWLPLPAYFALVGSTRVPSTVIQPDETPGGERVENPTLDPVSQANWRLRMNESAFQARCLAASLLEELENFVDVESRTWDGLAMNSMNSVPLVEADQVSELQRTIANLNADRTEEKVQAALRTLASVYAPKTPELKRASYDLFSALFCQ